MSLLGNLIWIIFGGFLGAFFWLFAALIMAVSIIGIPFSYAAMRMASFAFLPFGRHLADARDVGDSRILGTGLANLLWFLFAGIWLCLFHCIVGILFCITVFGIPFGLAHFKLASVALTPLGKRIVEH